MPTNTQDILEVVCILADEENIQITVKEALKGGLIAGISATTGGIVFGPVGILIGGTLGSCIAAYLTQGKFRSAAEIIRYHMKSDDQKRLVDAVMKVIENVDVTDATRLAALVAGDNNFRAKILDALIMHLKNEMHMQIID